MTVPIVLGNPKPNSRTLRAAELVAERLTGKAPDERSSSSWTGSVRRSWPG